MVQLKVDIDMPKSCGECPFNYESIGCMAITGDDWEFKYTDEDVYEEKRLPNCPLEEVKV